MESRGFTLIEALVAIAMLAAVAVMAAPFLSDALAQKDVDRFAAEAADALREAQSSVMSGRENARFGVHFEASKFVFFKGAAYNAADPDNADHQLSGFVGVSSVSLSPGGSCTVSSGSGNCDVHFASHFGVPTESGTVVLTDSGGNTKTVTIGAAGMVDVN